MEDNNEISWYCGEYDVVPITYSIDNGNTWETYTAENSGTTRLLATINKDEKILFKENTAKYVYGASFISSKQLNIEGNVMSLVYGDDFANNDTTPNDFRLSGLFQTSNGVYQHSLYVVDASNLILPLETLTENCYEYMFYGCTSLTTAPGLTATTLAESCYNSMFNGCTSLTTAPGLTATTLANGCYRNMFNGCTNLNSITCLATDISASNCTNSWVSGVAASGTFTKAASMSSWTTGISGIPEGWTVQDAS